MRKLLRDRRGTVAFVTVAAAIPLIGAVALGAEGGSWYITRQHAQNAADAAAYSGALKRACEIGTACADTQSVSYRGRQFAAQNAFCNTGDTAYPGSKCAALPAGTSQTVTVNPVATATSATADANGLFVRAVVTQQQPTYIARVLNLTTVNVGATAVAKVAKLANPCLLALSGSISFQGSPNILAHDCGIATNSTAKNAINFTGGGMTMDVGSLSAAGGCQQNTGTFCKPAQTYMPPVANPFAALDAAMAAANLLTLPNCTGAAGRKGLSDGFPYSATNPCKNNNVTLTGNTDITLPGGVYFISGKLEIKGNGSLLGTATFVLLPGATLSMKGGGTINVTGNTTVTPAQLPPALQANASLFSNMVIYDYQTTPDAIQIGGNSQIVLKGNMYLPKTAVTFQGNPTVGSTTCGNQLIAASIAFNGNATLKFDFANQDCPSAIQPQSQYVSLVQ